jgi:hypothetical protein
MGAEALTLLLATAKCAGISPALLARALNVNTITLRAWSRAGSLPPSWSSAVEELQHTLNRLLDRGLLPAGHADLEWLALNQLIEQARDDSTSD